MDFSEKVLASSKIFHFFQVQSKVKVAWKVMSLGMVRWEIILAWQEDKDLGFQCCGYTAAAAAAAAQKQKEKEDNGSEQHDCSPLAMSFPLQKNTKIAMLLVFFA